LPRLAAHRAGLASLGSSWESFAAALHLIGTVANATSSAVPIVRQGMRTHAAIAACSWRNHLLLSWRNAATGICRRAFFTSA
jgi:hypothetical protein